MPVSKQDISLPPFESNLGNGRSITSVEFTDFLQCNGIRHVTSAPYHPSTNGLAERDMQTFKEHIKRSTQASLQSRISRFLLTYRNTQHSTTGVSPAELLLGRHPRTLFDLMLPDLSIQVQDKQAFVGAIFGFGRSFYGNP